VINKTVTWDTTISVAKNYRLLQNITQVTSQKHEIFLVWQILRLSVQML